jgi:hypothetical protein
MDKQRQGTGIRNTEKMRWRSRNGSRISKKKGKAMKSGKKMKGRRKTKVKKKRRR